MGTITIKNGPLLTDAGRIARLCESKMDNMIKIKPNTLQFESLLSELIKEEFEKLIKN